MPRNILTGSPAIRLYRQSDAAALSELYVRSIEGLARPYYSPEQIGAWAGEVATPEETHAKCSDGRLVLVAAGENDDPLAYIDLEMDGHIDMLFCLPEAAGKGFASALYQELECRAAALGMARLYVEASEGSRPFFARKGFTLLSRHDFEAGGIAMHNYNMEKILRPRT
ncbi:MAG: GNAT family N-acetyltransferase [Rhizobiales bacterium]|nr:GNAT family N-acetyltransferase [Hyphomicrobiales bacterium]